MFDVAMAETAVVIDILICFTWIKQPLPSTPATRWITRPALVLALKNIPGPGANG